MTGGELSWDAFDLCIFRLFVLRARVMEAAAECSGRVVDVQAEHVVLAEVRVAQRLQHEHLRVRVRRIVVALGADEKDKDGGMLIYDWQNDG